VHIVQDEADDGRGPVRPLGPLDEREGAVLERAPAVSLGVQVAHLLDLQGPLHGDALAVALAQQEEVLGVLELGRDGLALRPQTHRHAHADRQALQGKARQGNVRQGKARQGRAR
jgi:hypothetical protein